ncbi:MAG: hypothetical protein GF347_04035 [Candidatus Moranbacteria bacterium]|nr:hypothetical protein [Candidatus Moranbacteria bacterium]
MFLPSPPKVSAREFKGGYRHSKMGKKIKKLKGLKRAQKKALYQELERRGLEDRSLTQAEVEGAIRKFIDNPNDRFSPYKAKGLKDDLEEITGYENVEWHSSLAHKYGKIKDKNYESPLSEDDETESDSHHSKAKQKSSQWTIWHKLFGLKKPKKEDEKEPESEPRTEPKKSKNFFLKLLDTILPFNKK